MPHSFTAIIEKSHAMKMAIIIFAFTGDGRVANFAQRMTKLRDRNGPDKSAF
jgi:hypothetical protein